MASAREDDPYQYQYGFGNHHSSEAIAGALPRGGKNVPQKGAFGLKPEFINGTPFISSREAVSNVWMYRVFPGVAHRPPVPVATPREVESCFLPSNPAVSFTPLSHTWGPLPPAAPSDERITFPRGLRTIAGQGDSTLKEGLAVHMYSFNASMHREAFVNNDGDLLLVPQRGVLDVQTELGYLRIRPGDIAVLPACIRFAVRIVSEAGREPGSQLEALPSPPSPQGHAAGYALELFGGHFALPELGPLGSNGLAHVNDFQYPVAAFDIDDSNTWQITAKVAGRFYGYAQRHTPFDVVAWHGRYAPFKYDLSLFGLLSGNAEQLDPTAYCVLTAPSRSPGVSLADFCVFGEKWAVAAGAIRIPYYHRTVATEMCGVIKGTYGGSVRPLEPGGLSFEGAYIPHGETYEAWKKDEAKDFAGPEVSGRGFLGFMFHITAHVGLTEWATKEHPDIRLEKEELWDTFRADFLDHAGQLGLGGSGSLSAHARELTNGYANGHAPGGSPAKKQ